MAILLALEAMILALNGSSYAYSGWRLEDRAGCLQEWESSRRFVAV